MVLSQTDKAKLELEATGCENVVRISGVVDEDMNLGLVLSGLAGLSPPPTTLVFDLGNIKRINSCGLREWILFLKKVPASMACIFDQVATVLVEQASPIPDVLGRGRGIVRSFQAPYFCDKCKKEVTCALQPGQVTTSGSTPVAPEQKCPTCASILEFDAIPSEYFYFLKWSKVGGPQA